MKVRVIEGEPSRLMSGAFLQLDLSSHDAVVIIRDKIELQKLVTVLAEALRERKTND